MTYNDSELDVFSKQNDIEIIEINNKSSMKSNIYVIARNLVNLVPFLNKLKSAIFRDKICFQLNNIEIDTYDEQIINGITYSIYRDDVYQLSIRRQSIDSWNTEQLICQLKDSQGVILNPQITTQDSIIIIKFTTPISDSFSLYII